MGADSPVQTFASLTAERFPHAFIGRIPEIDVAHDKAEALRRLDGVHRQARQQLGLWDLPFATAEQIHGSGIAIVSEPVSEDRQYSGCDGLATNQPDTVLGIYVADCCAVYIADPIRRAIGLVHSGRKGTELGIVTEAISRMREAFDSKPADLIVQLSPCIRPPHYEIDFAAEIISQARAAGVTQIHDAGDCTACDLDRYYSYRAEKGRTGRMLALLALIN